MEMLIYAIICALCYSNEWDLITNSHNATMRSIENIMVYKKKNYLPLILIIKGYEISSLYIHLITIRLTLLTFSDIFYAIPFHGHPEISRSLYLPNRHMSTSKSCTNPFMNILECFFFYSILSKHLNNVPLDDLLYKGLLCPVPLASSSSTVQYR
jgi:hypothetical protein